MPRLMPAGYPSAISYRTPHAHARSRNYALKRPVYKVPQDVIDEIVRNRLTVGGKVFMPTIEAPYGLYDSKGKKVSSPGIVYAYNFNKKFTLSTFGIEICAPSLIEEFSRHKDFLKLLACREAVKKWEQEEVETGKLGPFLTNDAVSRQKLEEFSKLNGALKKEIEFYAKILHVAFRYLKINHEMQVIHTEHLLAKIYAEGPKIPFPERVSQGGAVFKKDSKGLPEAILSELGVFTISSFAIANDPKKLRELSARVYSEFNMVDINRELSYSTQYPFMENVEVQIKHKISNKEDIEQSRLMRKWFEIRDYVFLLHKL